MISLKLFHYRQIPQDRLHPWYPLGKMCWISWQIWSEECFWASQQFVTVEQKAQGSCLEERISVGQSYTGDQCFSVPFECCTRHSLRNGINSLHRHFRVSSCLLMHICPIQVLGSYPGHLMANIDFSLLLIKTFPNSASFHKVFCLTYDC